MNIVSAISRRIMLEAVFRVFINPLQHKANTCVDDSKFTVNQLFRFINTNMNGPRNLSCVQ